MGDNPSPNAIRIALARLLTLYPVLSGLWSILWSRYAYGNRSDCS